MYQIHYGDYILYDPRLANSDDKLIVQEASVDLAVGTAGDMTFVLPADHPYLGVLKRMSGVVELLDGSTPIYRGRITRDTKDFYGAHEIETEGLMACLNDSVIEPFAYPGDLQDNDEDYKTAAESGNVVEYFFNWILGQHNAQVSSDQQLKPGVCTVSDPNNYMVRSSDDYLTAMDVFKDKLTGSSLGGYLLVRYESDGTYLDYYAELPLTNTQPVEFASNLLDLTSEVDGTDIYTAVLPVGADGLTISELADGDLTDDLVKSGKIIYSKSGVETYGRITRYSQWDDVTVASNLQTKAQTALASGGLSMPETITCKAADLGWQDDVQHFRVGRMTLLASEPHGYSASYPLLELSIDILDPGNTQITMGGTKQTYTGAQIDAAAKAVDYVNETRSEIDARIDSVVQTTTTQMTSIEQSASGIVSKALENYVSESELSTYKESVTSEITQSASSVRVDIKKNTEKIDSVGDDLKDTKTTLNTYFEFTTDGLIIGKSGSDLRLKLTNNRISFLSNGAEVAYINNDKLYITDGEFLNCLTLGNFGFFPRDNGNLSFKKVK